jgi:Tol biopolymer transport system component
VQIGTQLGRYEVLGTLGKGGMGEVYLARDNVGRDVAVKVLPEDLVADRGRLRRLRSEARVLAKLNHPNIASLYAFEEEQGPPFLVLELVEGETLADRLRAGRVPRRPALQIAVQIADALAAAHERGIVHRDLKPSNVMLTGQGLVKLLDFGLARREPPVIDTDEVTKSQSKDSTTTPGRFSGTPAYMSPEQTRGDPASSQSDIWAFGCVLYEMLTGRPPFAASTRADLTAAILEAEPDWDGLEDCPPKIRDLVRRCLRKDPADRQHHIADARIEIEEALEPASAESGAPKKVFDPRTAVAAAGLGIGALALLWLLLKGGMPNVPPEPVRRFTIDLGSKLAFGIDYPASVAISPNGDLLAYVGESDGQQRIYVRPMDEFSAHSLDGTAGALQPFFSPDAKWLGFFADGKLKKISLKGGAPVTLSEAPNGMGGAWSRDGWIVFAPSSAAGLRRISEDGSGNEAFSQVKPDEREQAHWSPVLLPDQHTVMFTVYTGGRNADSRVALQSLGETAHHTVLEGGSHGRLLAPNLLIYGRGSELLAAEFDSKKRIATGTSFSVLTGIQDTPALGAPVFALSDAGTLVYAAAVTNGYAGRVVWLDRSGQAREAIEAGRTYYRPRLSPDGSRVAYHSPDTDFNIWVKDLSRGSHWKLTKDRAYDGFAVWSPDSRQIAFTSAREGSRTLFVQAADGMGEAERLLPVGNPQWPTSWSPDGRWLAFHQEDPLTGLDVWLLDMQNRQARPFLHSSATEAWGRFSPDGQWLAYHSNESGVFEVYVRSVHEPARRFQVSVDGGMVPIWSPTADQIYYYRGTQLMASSVHLTPSPAAGRAHLLFGSNSLEVNDVNPRGDRFLAVDAPTSVSIDHLNLVLGWRQTVAGLAKAQ